jgi:hypothetical protein
MQYRRAVPFRPFVLALKDGRRFVVSKPEEISRNSRFTWVAVAADADSAEVVDGALLSHVEILSGGGPLQERST